VLSSERRADHGAGHPTRQLGHALISFVFDTTSVALALNVVFQLLSGE
jgi:hypothetical protein